MSGEISVINTIDTAHEDMIVSHCFVVYVEGQNIFILKRSLFGILLSLITLRVHCMEFDNLMISG